MRYAVVLEDAGRNYSAYVPDLPGCIVTGATIDEAQVQIREAIRFHIEDFRLMAYRSLHPRAEPTMSTPDRLS